jgi:uncharacterized YigZ family protein
LYPYKKIRFNDFIIVLFRGSKVSYKTIKIEATGEYEEKKSLFIGSVKRVSTEEEAKEFISYVKSQHKEARHNVYAYVIGSNKGIQRYSDDGEPQGTGGIPVLEVIKKNDISDTALVVTRYFGGILLGSAGLVRAYGKAASLAVKNGGVVEKVEGCQLKITIEYDLLGKLQYLFAQKEWIIEDTEYTDKVVISIFCELNTVQEINDALTELTSNRFSVKKCNEGLYFKEGNRLLIITD